MRRFVYLFIFLVVAAVAHVNIAQSFTAHSSQFCFYICVRPPPPLSPIAIAFFVPNESHFHHLNVYVTRLENPKQESEMSSRGAECTEE